MQLLYGYVTPVTLGVTLLAIAAVLIFIRVSRIITYIRNDSIGIVEKLWSGRGSVREGFLALRGEAGFRPEVLRGGLHFFMPFQYRIHVQPLVTVPQGTVGYAFARGGVPLPAGQTLGRSPAGVTFEDARAFILAEGQRGPQRRILREGVYAINTAQFVVFAAERSYAVSLQDDKSMLTQMRHLIEERGGFHPVVIPGESDVVGIATVHDGPALEQDEIIAPTVGIDPADAASFHNSFQDPEKFLVAGGRRGRQEQVLVEGTYYVNRLFATVEMLPKTVIEIGHVGVVVSYTGPRGADITGADYKHGELVGKGQRGVWETALQPGKYALNPYALKVVQVPTTNFVLRWIEGRMEGHRFDENLSEIKLITKDAFEPILPLSIVLHIAYEDAPRVVQQFADIKLLVEQTLDPMVSAYFKDTAQSRTLIELISSRAEIQEEAVRRMGERFRKYRLNLMEVMIGTPRAPHGDQHIDAVYRQLRDRQLAKEQVETFTTQKLAAETEKGLREAEATAAVQPDLTRSLISIKVADNEGQALLARKNRDAEAIRITAAATAMQTTVQGEAEANRLRAVGLAEAEATEAKVKAFGGAENQLRKEIAGLLETAIRETKVPVVPQVVLGGNGEKGTIVDALLGLLMASGGFDGLTRPLDPQRRN